MMIPSSSANRLATLIWLGMAIMAPLFGLILWQAATCGGISLAHATDLQIRSPSLGVTEVFLVNSGNMALVFELRPKGGVWTDYRIEPGVDKTYSCEECEKFEFSMVTEGKGEVRYTLTPQERYRLIWDGDKGMWDLKHVPSAR